MTTTIDALYTNLRIDPTMDESTRLVMSDVLLDAGFTEEQVEAFREGKIPLAPLDKWAVILYASCRFSPGSFPKKFAASVEYLDVISPKQFRVLWSMVWHYRKQIGHKTGDLGTGKIQAVLEMMMKVRRGRAKLNDKPADPSPNDSEGRADKLMVIAPAFQAFGHLAGE